MIDLIGLDPKAVEGNGLLRLRQFQTVDGKRKLRCDHTQRVDYLSQSLRSYEQKGFCALRIAHREQHSRQTADMIRMIMGKADNINGFRAPSFFFEGDLGAFAAVDQYACPVVPRHHRREPPVRQRHHAARA